MEAYELLRDWLEWARDGDHWHSGGATFADAWRLAVERATRGLADAESRLASGPTREGRAAGCSL